MILQSCMVEAGKRLVFAALLCRRSPVDTDRLAADLIGGRAAQEGDKIADLRGRHELPGGLLLGEQFEPRLIEALALRAARARIWASTSGVKTQPGAIALTVTPVCAVSRAATLVRPTTPCFEATYAALLIDATRPWTEEMLMIRPQLRRSIPGSTSRMQ